MENASMAIPTVDHHFQISSPETCVRTLVPSLFPGWATTNSDLGITRLTEGTTNSLFKVSLRSRDTKVDVLIKVYGSGTDITIDREKEIFFHSILADHKLAPALLVRFSNGHAYPFVHGKICSLTDISREEIKYGVSRELANWHGTLPKSDTESETKQTKQPNVWITAEKWLNAIRETSVAETSIKRNLKAEFAYLLDKLHGDGNAEMVFTHGDLLHANIIIKDSSTPGIFDVSFIDYEHSTYAPVAFELANHFSEWAGLSCNYESLPSRCTRRSFVETYLERRREIFQDTGHKLEEFEAAVDKLMFEVDSWRGFPGFYWGLCALIQHASLPGEADFDYYGYAQLRFAEYYAWKGEDDGSREKSGNEMPLREKVWDALSPLGLSG